MFISPAYAQQAAGQGDLLGMILPLVLIFVVFYFLLIRPQQKRMKQHREMIASIGRGDVVVTGGGIVGKVVKAGETDVEVEIADGVRINVVASTISDVREKKNPPKIEDKRGK